MSDLQVYDLQLCALSFCINTFYDYESVLRMRKINKQIETDMNHIMKTRPEAVCWSGNKLVVLVVKSLCFKLVLLVTVNKQ